MTDYKNILSELFHTHLQYSHEYKRGQIPVSLLPQKYDVYWDALEEARNLAKTQEDLNRVIVSKLRLEDFIDLEGEVETQKLFDKAELLSRTDPEFNTKAKFFN